MTSPIRVDKATILEALTPSAVLARFGVEGRQRGDELRTRLCPACGPRSRDAVAINLVTGRWVDHAHGCSGDLLALVAAGAGLDIARDFVSVLTIAADIAGVVGADVSDEERTRRRDAAANAAAERAKTDRTHRRERRDAAHAAATSAWERLDTRSDAGEAYLKARGLASAVRFGDVLFAPGGDVAVALYAGDGRIVNVVVRRLPGREPKVRGLADCPTAGTLVGALPELESGRDVVVVEGVFDALTARLAWPSAVVLGAHGAGNLPKVAAAAATPVRARGGRLLLVPHADDAGERFAVTAGRAALAGGMRLHHDLIVVDLGGEKDLNDAWRAGWRPL